MNNILYLQVGNDSLNLRQPIHITSLIYLRGSSMDQKQLLTASQSGVIRRYDTRTGGRPIADWKVQNLNSSINIVAQSTNEKYDFALIAFIKRYDCCDTR